MTREGIRNTVLGVIIVLSTYFYITSGVPALPRTCEDLRCLGTEVCVMEQGPCSYTGRCPRNPTCRISKRTTSGSCETVRCPRGQFCSLIEDRCLWRPCPSRPTCVSTNSTGTGIREVYTRRPNW